MIEDIVVHLERPLPPGDGGPSGGAVMVAVGSDTAAVIERRQGGSAANVCVATAALGRPARFIGQVGDDEVGRRLEAALLAVGVEPILRRAGRTGTVIVLGHLDGERSMVTDRGASVELSDPDPAWLDGMSALHLPLYSLAGGRLARTALALGAEARARGLQLSVDLSSTVLLEALGPRGWPQLLAQLRPEVVVANEAEAASAARHAEVARMAPLVVVKRGPRSCLVYRQGSGPEEVPAVDIGPLSDSTGAGDAFAAGLLAALMDGAGPLAAAAAGHQAAAHRLAGQQPHGPSSA